MPARHYHCPTVTLGLRLDRAVLDERIGARVEQMWSAGLLEEVQRLEPLGLRRGRTASRALGYAQALAQLDGTMTEQEAKEQTVALTRRFARRQESWFGPDHRITWLDAAARGLTEAALDVVYAAIGDNGAHG
jgi:tRNA dimethylallyltransferase